MTTLLRNPRPGCSRCEAYGYRCRKCAAADREAKAGEAAAVPKGAAPGPERRDGDGEPEPR